MELTNSANIAATMHNGAFHECVAAAKRCTCVVRWCRWSGAGGRERHDCGVWAIRYGRATCKCITLCVCVCVRWVFAFYHRSVGRLLVRCVHTANTELFFYYVDILC